MTAPRAKRALGQNFLVDPNLQRKIVDAIDPQPDDVVIEIGPGTGALTRHLAGRVGRLVVIEKDHRLAAALRDEFVSTGVEVVHGDALDIPLDDIASGRSVKVIGNIPYNITTPLIFRLLEQPFRPALVVLMVQREVADRIVAEPGTREYGALTVGVGAVADASRLFQVKRGAFRPVPNVDSTVIRITPHDPPRIDDADEVELRMLTRVAFSRRRKQLQKILRTAPEYALEPAHAEAALRTVGVEPDARPETMAPETFVQLARTLRTDATPMRARPAAADPFDALRAAVDPDIVALITHELRSPVAAILGYAELLADGVYGEVDERARDGLGRVSSAARQLRGLIDGIELLLGNGTPDIEPVADVDVGAVVADVIDAARPEATMRGLTIETSIGALEPLRTDPDALARALHLLLGASIRNADGTLHVRVTAGDPGVIIECPQPVETDACTGAHLRLAMAGRLLDALGGFLDTGSTDAVRAVVRAIDVPETNP